MFCRGCLASLLLMKLPSSSEAFFASPQPTPILRVEILQDAGVICETIERFLHVRSYQIVHSGRTKRWASSCLVLSLGPDDDNEPSVDEIHESADAIFGMIDSDADGYISYSELQTHLIDVCGYTQDAVDAMYYALDADMDGNISREELRMGFVRYENLRNAPGIGMGQAGGKNDDAAVRQDAAAIFDSIDTNVSGTIDDDELRNFLRSKGYGDNAIDSFYSTLDVDSDGNITREELSDAFVRYSALRYATGAESGDAQEFEL